MKVGDKTYPSGPPGLSRGVVLPSLESGWPGLPEGPFRASVEPTDSGAVLGVPEAELTPQVRAALDQLMSEVQTLRGDLERARRRSRRLEALADQDALTPGLNRRAFIRELSRMLAFAERYQVPSSLVYFDVNEMKRINDGFGHAAGDAALRHVATVLIENVRSFDVVGRLGGDEFAVILAQISNHGAIAKAHTLAQAIEARPAAWNGSDLDIQITFGVHTFFGAEPVDEALHAADRAMYARKKDPTSPREAA